MGRGRKDFRIANPSSAHSRRSLLSSWLFSRRLLPLLLYALIGPESLHAEPAALMVTNAWAPPSLAGAPTGVVYFTLSYPAGPADRLVSFSTPVAERAELHRSEMTNGVMSMRPAGPLPLKPGASVTLSPGGLHLMLIGLKAPLKLGDRFALTLTFEHAAPLTVEVAVASRGGR